MSRKANKIKNEISDLIRQLIEIKLCVGYNFPQIRKVRTYLQVGLLSDGNFSIALKNKRKQIIYETLVKDNTYSMILNDGSILQISYTFNNEDLVSHRLVYFPKPLMMDGVDVDTENYGLAVKNPMIRFDYSSESHEDHYHSHSHLHVGDVEDCRIPVSAPMGPNLFIFFLLRNFYHSEGKDYFTNFKCKSGEIYKRTLKSCEKAELHIELPHIT